MSFNAYITSSIMTGVGVHLTSLCISHCKCFHFISFSVPRFNKSPNHMTHKNKHFRNPFERDVAVHCMRYTRIFTGLCEAYWPQRYSVTGFSVKRERERERERQRDRETDRQTDRQRQRALAGLHVQDSRENPSCFICTGILLNKAQIFKYLDVIVRIYMLQLISTETLFYRKK